MNKEEALEILYSLRLDWEEQGLFCKLNQTDINAIGMVISELEIANKKLDKIENKIKCLGKFDGEQCTRSFKMWAADFNEILSIIGDKQ